MAFIGKFGVDSNIDKILSTGDIESPKAKSAINKLMAKKPESTTKIIELLISGPKIHSSTLIELLDRLLDNTTISTVMTELTKLDTLTQKNVVTLISKNHSFDPHTMLPYLKSPLPIQTCRDLLMAHRKRFTALGLLRAIGKANPDLWETLFELVHGNINDAVLPEAIASSRSKNPVLRAHITQLIAEFSSPTANEALQHLAFDNDDDVRGKAIIGLTRHKADIPARDLVRLMQNAKHNEFPFIKVLLVNCKDRDLGTYLAKVLLSKNNDMTEIVMEVLKDIVNENLIRDILKGLEGKDSWVKEDVMKALGERGGDRYVEAIGKLVKDADGAIRSIALEALEQGDISNPEVLDALRESLNSDDYLAKQKAIRKLGDARDTASVEKLLSLMKKDPQSCPAILQALGNIGDPKALPDVFDLLNSNEIQLQRAALQAIPKLINKQYAPGIRAQLIEHADKLHVAVGQTLIEILEILTSDFSLDRDSAYSNSLKKIVTQISADKEQLVTPPETKTAAKSDPALNLEPDTILADRYRLIREIGRGGYGSVWLVEDTIIQEELVMKFLHEALVSDGIAVERFIRELRFARKVTHPNIIRLYDYMNFENVSAISMEYFDGLPLSSEIEKGPMDIPRMIEMINMISNALYAAHEVEVIHRDLKPANILLNTDDEIKIVDFGIAAASKHAESRLTRTGTLIGTPTYISPEQIQGKEVDCRTDIYSLGIIMYEMLTGSPPYRADDPMALVFMHVEGNARRIEETNPLVSVELADIIHRCISPDPEDRFHDMAELGKTLSQLDTK